MWNDSLVTANVPVSDLDRARRFYADTLCLTPAEGTIPCLDDAATG